MDFALHCTSAITNLHKNLVIEQNWKYNTMMTATAKRGTDKRYPWICFVTLCHLKDKQQSFYA